MKKARYMAVTAVLFVLVFVLGCTGGNKEDTTGISQGYSLAVSPTDVVPGGVITVDLRLNNPYENQMKDVTVDMLSTGLPSEFTVDGEMVSTADKFTIEKQQEYPAIMTITIPDEALSGTVSPKTKVCYDYRLNFFFDSALKTKSKAAEEVTLSKQSESGPVGINVIGLDNVYYENNQATGVIEITNAGNGEIKSINEIGVNVPKNVKQIDLSYSKCTGIVTNTTDSTTNVTTVTGVKMVKNTTVTGACYVLSDGNVVKSGISPKIKYTLQTYNAATDKAKEISIERIRGYVDVGYCFEIPLGTITITAVK